MLIKTKDDPNFIFEEYKGHLIASHKDNVAERDINNCIYIYKSDEFPDYAFIMGLDDSKTHGNRKSFPHNIADAKAYIDWVVEIRQKQNEKKVEIPKPRKSSGRRM